MDTHLCQTQLKVVDSMHQINILTQIIHNYLSFILEMVSGYHGVPFCWLCVELNFLCFFCRGWQCAQPLVLSYTREQRKSQQP